LKITTDDDLMKYEIPLSGCLLETNTRKIIKVTKTNTSVDWIQVSQYLWGIKSDTKHLRYQTISKGSSGRFRSEHCFTRI